MRLCYASADFGIQVFGDKGAALHIQQMIKAFAALGHDVTLVASQTGSAPLDFPARIIRARTPAPAISHQDLLLAEFNDRVFKERRNMAIADSIETEILRQHAQAPFDAIYERYSLWSSAGVRASRKLGVPAIIEVNAPLLLEQREYRKLVLSDEAEKIERDAFQSADLVIAVSEEVRDYVALKSGKSDHVVVLPNGVDLDAFTPVGPRAGVALDPAIPVIGFSGSLKPWHGVEDLMQAHALLRTAGIQCGLLFVGEGPMNGWIDGYARGAGIAHLVHQTGWVKHSQIPSYIHAMDIAVAPYPKLDNFYFSPLKLFEYMACARPVVASRIGQIQQVVDHGVSGMLYEPGDAAALAEAIKQLLADSALSARLGTAAAQSVQGRSWNECAKTVTQELARRTQRRAQKAAS